MTTNPQQVAALLKDVIARGVDTKDAVPTVKILVQAKIFSLDQLSPSNLPEGLRELSKNDPKWIQRLLRPARRRSTTSTASQQAKAKQKSPATQKKKKNLAVVVVHPPPVSSTPATIQINRAPLLTLWATVVAEHVLELEFHEALTFGSAVAAMTAKAKGQSLGIYQKEAKAGVTTSSTTDAAIVAPPAAKVGEKDNDKDHEGDAQNKSNNNVIIETISFFGYTIPARRVPKDPKSISSMSSSSSVFLNKTNSWLLALDTMANNNNNNNNNDQDHDDDTIPYYQPSSILTYLQKKFPSSSLGFVYTQMQRAVHQAGGREGLLLQEVAAATCSCWNYYMAVRPKNIGVVGAAGWGNHGTVSTAALAEWHVHVGGGDSDTSDSGKNVVTNDHHRRLHNKPSP